mgnify:CR=1 FL=1
MLLSHLMRPSSWTILTKFAVHIILFDKLFLFFIYGKDKLESEENALFNKPKPFRDMYSKFRNRRRAGHKRRVLSKRKTSEF